MHRRSRTTRRCRRTVEARSPIRATTGCWRPRVSGCVASRCGSSTRTLPSTCTRTGRRTRTPSPASTRFVASPRPQRRICGRQRRAFTFPRSAHATSHKRPKLSDLG
eukprot:Amastigsp_a176008_143.p3 type:complete len:107 gc:universal Amastigsp_a176008_143:416-96(-)